MSSNVLAARDVNTSSPSKSTAAMEDAKPKSLEYHRQVLQSRMKEEQATKSYVSPSDNIMSPCTAKLSAMKSKNLMKGKPQSLFAKASAKNAANSGLGMDVSSMKEEEKSYTSAGNVESS